MSASPRAGPKATLSTLVHDAFAAGGALDRGNPLFTRRAGQVAMAAGIAQAFEAGASLVVEAGCGIGKTLAYLVPLLLGGQRALLCTATHLLQEQLVHRDIPEVCKALGRPVRVVMLKGRSNYVCPHRLEQACQVEGAASGRDPALSADLLAVRQWTMRTREGVFSELGALGERPGLRELAGSTQENCLGAACPRLAECHFMRARRATADADWVVLNHHLFLTDLKHGGDQGIVLGGHWPVMVFDEAHRLPEVARQTMGTVVDAQRLRSFARDLAAQGQAMARGMQPWAWLALSIDQAVRQVDLLSSEQPVPARQVRWSKAAPCGVEPARWRHVARSVDGALRAAHGALSATAEASIELRRLLERCHELILAWRSLASDAGVNGSTEAQWLDWGGEGRADWRVVRTPVDHMQLFRRFVGGASPFAASCVFTSATLGNDDTLSWFTERLGLAQVPGLQKLRIPSPFDHEMAMALHVPMALPEPADPRHVSALADCVADWALRLDGRTLVLTTSVRSARLQVDRLRWWQAKGGAHARLDVLDATRSPRDALLKRFRAPNGRPPSDGNSSVVLPKAMVLVASMAFWEGVDLAGEVLQLLVIDKLPFASPEDPVSSVRSRQLVQEGKDPFIEGVLPEAELVLRQGAGRLIRSAEDRGVLVVADRRLMTRDYGMRLLAALPAHRLLADEAEMSAELDRLRLTRASTRDHWSS